MAENGVNQFNLRCRKDMKRVNQYDLDLTVVSTVDEQTSW